MLVMDRTFDLSTPLCIDYSYMGLAGELLRLESNLNIAKVPELAKAALQHAQSEQDKKFKDDAPLYLDENDLIWRKYRNGHQHEFDVMKHEENQIIKDIKQLIGADGKVPKYRDLQQQQVSFFPARQLRERKLQLHIAISNAIVEKFEPKTCGLKDSLSAFIALQHGIASGYDLTRCS